MSIELFAGKSNIFESNWRSGKILGEIQQSHACLEVKGYRTDQDPFLAAANARAEI